MRFCKKVTTLFVVILLLTALAPTVFAAGSTNVQPGETATLTFQFSDVYNVDGTFAVNDPKGVVAGYTVTVADAGATITTLKGDRLWAAPGADPVRTSVTVLVKVEIKEDAVSGAGCTVSFNGIYGDANEEPGNEHDIYRSATVTVKSAQDDQSEKPVTQTPVQTTQPTKPAVVKPTVSYTELEKQIAIANGLINDGYTTASWEAMQQALADGKKALKSKDQSEVNAAAKTLADCVVSLVKMEYSELRQALEKADALSDTEALGDLWAQLIAAMDGGNALLTSGDQQAVDDAADRISGVLAQIENVLDDLKAPEIVEVEVPVEILPEDEFCNIPSHYTWPVLLIISLGFNLALLVLLVVVITKKKRSQDNTPLVDYDIDDDISL